MAQTGFTSIQHYHSSTPGQMPVAGNLVQGELAINTADRKIYTENAAGSVVPLGGGAAGGGVDQIFYENDITVTTDYTITASRNAMSAGPIVISSGVTVTIPTGSVWTIV